MCGVAIGVWKGKRESQMTKGEGFWDEKERKGRWRSFFVGLPADKINGNISVGFTYHNIPWLTSKDMAVLLFYRCGSMWSSCGMKNIMYRIIQLIIHHAAHTTLPTPTSQVEQQKRAKRRRKSGESHTRTFYHHTLHPTQHHSNPPHTITQSLITPSLFFSSPDKKNKLEIGRKGRKRGWEGLLF